MKYLFTILRFFRTSMSIISYKGYQNLWGVSGILDISLRTNRITCCLISVILWITVIRTYLVDGDWMSQLSISRFNHFQTISMGAQRITEIKQHVMLFVLRWMFPYRHFVILVFIQSSQSQSGWVHPHGIDWQGLKIPLDHRSLTICCTKQNSDCKVNSY